MPFLPTDPFLVIFMAGFAYVALCFLVSLPSMIRYVITGR